MGASSSVAVCSAGLRCFEFKRVAPVVLTALLLAIATLLTCGSGRAAAQPGGEVTFEVAQPLSLTWAQLVHGKAVYVCNGGARAVSRFHLVPTEFTFTRGGAPIASVNVIALRRLRGSLPAGGCAAVLLHAKSDTPLDAGDYSGALLVVAAGDGSARLPMTVTTATKSSAAPAGATEPATLSIASPTPWSHGGDATLLLSSASASEEELTIGEGCEKASPDERDCPFIGNLYRGSQIVRVSVIGPSRFNSDDDVQEVPVRLHSSQHPVGDFEGAVTLQGASRPIKVKLTAKDAWWCALIALLLGVLFALAVQLWNGRWQPKGTLLERRRAIRTRYGDYSVPGHPGIELSSGGLSEYLKGIDEAIETYASSVIQFDATSEAYKAIDASLKLAEDDAKTLTGPGGLKRALDALGREVKTTTDVLNGKEVADTPEILKLAGEILAPAPLAVGEAMKRAKQAEQLLPPLVKWRKLASRLMANVVWLRALSANQARAKTAKEDPTTLTRIGVDLWSLREQLFEAVDACDTAAIGRSCTLSRAFTQVANLGAKHEVAEPAPTTALSVFRTGRALPTMGYPGPKGDGLTVKQVYEDRLTPNVQPARPAELPDRKLRRLIGDTLALAASVAVSVVGGFSAFYFAKSFGSFEDYLTVIVIGSAAQTVVKGVLNQTSILLHDFAPTASVVPAKVVVP